MAAIVVVYVLRSKRSSPGTSSQVQPTVPMTPLKQEYQPHYPQELEHPTYLSELEQPPPLKNVSQQLHPTHLGKAELDSNVGATSVSHELKN